MPATLNQLEQAEVLAIGVAHVLLGKATPLWPTTTRAHPSFWVTVHLLPRGAVAPDAAKYFPMYARWDVWENAVVPVLADKGNQFFPDDGADRNWQALALLDGDFYKGVVGKIQSALVEGFKSSGLMVPDPASTDVLAPAAPGEPVDRTPTVAEEDEMFIRFDIEEAPPQYTQFDVGVS